ncbi:radical SAM family heme chaperone HemW [Parapedobacter deserti]|uniref:Heme chaperone HemW n=1 Tax=Parapedobacter deserti TaxID=1912957 RepID=A0ABV7JKT6_9SPHI
MAGIYFHIPFCKQACYYCDFHFSTSSRHRSQMLQAMHHELALQANYLSQPVETIYFGGGTPSLLAADDLQRLVDSAASHFDILPGAEITIEANPDDLDDAKVRALRGTAVNRFSIGIQSFFEEDLRWMNRAHDAAEAHGAIQRVLDAGYVAITADLIYGYPLLSDDKWQYNVNRLLDFAIPHVSAYSMTVEPQTALAAFVRKGIQAPMDETQSAAQFEYLMDTLIAKGYVHYEISNFAKPGCYARHNSGYWKGTPYLGIGPSAHSFDGDTRQWNVRNNARYIAKVTAGVLPCEKEVLSEQDRLNEYIMTALRTIWGVDLDHVAKQFGHAHCQMLRSALQPFLLSGDLFLSGKIATLTRRGKLFADHIAAELFVS